MYCTRRRNRIRASGSARTTSTIVPRSLNSTSPESGSSARMITLDSVVLPQPLSPTRPKHSPRGMEKLTSSTARNAGPLRWPKTPAPPRCSNVLVTPRTSRWIDGASAGHGSVFCTSAPA